MNRLLSCHAGAIHAAVTLVAAACATLAPAPAASAQGCIDVEVRNVRPSQGTLMVAVYSDTATFNKQPSATTQLPAPSEATAKIQLCGIAGSPVALMLFQDLNGNGKLDKNVFGIPSEPWGASGTTQPTSAPSWESAAVVLDGKPIVVTLSN